MSQKYDQTGTTPFLIHKNGYVIFVVLQKVYG